MGREKALALATMVDGSKSKWWARIRVQGLKRVEGEVMNFTVVDIQPLEEVERVGGN